jgi:hypothetical protein
VWNIIVTSSYPTTLVAVKKFFFFVLKLTIASAVLELRFNI